MKITKLYILNILNEMTSTNLNHHVDNEFYDDFMHKDMNWLIENYKKIVKDFVDNYDKYEFDITHNYFKFITDWDISKLSEAIKTMVEE